MGKLRSFVHAYLTYEDKVWLKNYCGLWVPPGGHLVRDDIDPRLLSDIRDPEERTRDEIESLSGISEYSIHGEGDGTYLNRRLISRSPRGSHFHDITVYFGRFNSRPFVEEGKVQLFTMSVLEQIANNLDHKSKVLEFSRLALKYSEKYK